MIKRYFTMSIINLPRAISVHCSATPDAGNIIGFTQIDKWHKDRGWLDKASGVSCGYHFIIKRDAQIEVGRPVTSVPAAVLGHNQGMIAICYIGTREPAKVQADALISLIANLMLKYNINLENVMGHREYPSVNKDCPNIPGSILRLAVANKIGKTSQLRPMTTIAENLSQKPSSSSTTWLERFFLALGNMFKRKS